MPRLIEADPIVEWIMQGLVNDALEVTSFVFLGFQGRNKTSIRNGGT